MHDAAKHFTGELFCTHCRKHRPLLRNRLTLLALEHPDMVAGICRKCRSVVHAQLPHAVALQCTGIKAAYADMTLAAFIQKFTKRHALQKPQPTPNTISAAIAENTPQSPQEQSMASACEFVSEAKAEEFLSLRHGAMRALRKRGIAPRSHRVKGQRVYWLGDLQEHQRQRRQ